MSATEPLPHRAPVYGARSAKSPSRGAAQTARAPFPPLVEQAILFTFLAGGAGFWIAVIWWILR